MPASPQKQAVSLADGVKVARMSTTRLEGDIASVEYNYLVGRPEQPIANFSELHEFGLLTRELYEAAFREGRSVREVHQTRRK